MPLSTLIQAIMTQWQVESWTAQELLWNCTSYPFGSGDPAISSNDWYLRQLDVLYAASHGDTNLAFGIACKDCDLAMAKRTI